MIYLTFYNFVILIERSVNLSTGFSDQVISIESWSLDPKLGNDFINFISFHQQLSRRSLERKGSHVRIVAGRASWSLQSFNQWCQRGCRWTSFLEVSVSTRRAACHVWMGCYSCVGSGCCFPLAPKVRTTTRWTKALKDSDRCFLVIRKLTKHMSQQFWPANNQHFNCWWFLSCMLHPHFFAWIPMLLQNYISVCYNTPRYHKLYFECRSMFVAFVTANWLYNVIHLWLFAYIVLSSCIKWLLATSIVLVGIAWNNMIFVVPSHVYMGIGQNENNSPRSGETEASHFPSPSPLTRKTRDAVNCGVFTWRCLHAEVASWSNHIHTWECGQAY